MSGPGWPFKANLASPSGVSERQWRSSCEPTEPAGEKVAAKPVPTTCLSLWERWHAAGVTERAIRNQ